MFSFLERFPIAVNIVRLFAGRAGTSSRQSSGVQPRGSLDMGKPTSTANRGSMDMGKPAGASNRGSVDMGKAAGAPGKKKR